MPTLGGYYGSNVNSSFLSPRVGTISTSAMDSTMLTPNQKEELTKRVFNTVYHENEGTNIFERILGYAAASAVDLGDTLYAATPMTERGDVWNFVGDYGGNVGRDLEGFYERNRSGVELASGIVGAIGAAYLGGELLLPRIASSLARSTAISSSRLWQYGARANAATRAGVVAAQEEAVASAEAFKIWQSAAGRKFIANRVGKSVGKAAFEEGVIAATMHENKAVWSDDMSENLLWGGFGIGIAGTIGTFGARAELRRMANDSDLLQARRDTVDPQGLAWLRENQPESDWLAQAQQARMKESAVTTSLMLAARQATPEGATPALGRRFDSIRNEFEKQAIESLQKIASKGVPGAKGTNFAVRDSIGGHLREAMKADPLLLHGLDSIGTLRGQTVQEVLEGFVKKADELEGTEQAANIREANRLRDQQAMLLVNGHWLPATTPEAKALSHYRPGGTDFKQTARNTAEFRFETESGHNFTVNESFDFVTTGTSGKAEKVKTAAVRVDGKLYIGSTHLTAMEKAADALGVDVNTLLNRTDINPDDLGLFQTTRNRVIDRQEAQSLALKNRQTAATKKDLDAAGGIHASDLDLKRNQVNLVDLPINDRLQIKEGMSRVFRYMQKAGETYNLPENPSWFQLDAAVTYEKAGGKVRWHKTGIRNADDAVLAALKDVAEQVGDNGLGSYWDRMGWNLPLPTATERMYDSAGDVMKGILKAAKDGATLAEVKAVYKQLLSQHGFDLRRADDVPLRGDFFTFNQDSKGDWQDLAIGMFDNPSFTKPMTQYDLATQMAENKAARWHFLLGAKEDRTTGVIPELVSNLAAIPDLQLSMRMSHLADDQVTGLGGFIPQLAGEVLTREMRHRDSATMLALGRVRELTSRQMNDYLRRLVEGNLGDMTAQLGAAANASSKTLVNQFFSNVSGWDLEKAPVQLEDGKWGFVLRQTDANKKRLGRDIAENELLKNPRTGAAIVLDELGMQYVQGFQRIAHHLLEDRNRLRMAMGLPVIARRSWYAPPPNTKGKHIAFVMDRFDVPIPGEAIVAATEEELHRLIKAREARFENGERILERDRISGTTDVWDRAMMDWIDPGINAAPSRQQKGALAGEFVNPNAVGDALDWVKRQTEQIGTDTMRVIYDSQLGIARARAAAERGSAGLKTRNPTRAKASESLRTVWDEYEAGILGRSFGDLERSLTGRFMRPVESFINGGIEAVWPGIRFMAPSHVASWIGDLYDKVGLRAPKAVRSFDSLASQLGEYIPYKNAADYAEQNFGVSRPPEIRDIAQKLNKLSAALLLRYFELPQAAMNLLGIITTLPSILRTGRAPITTYFDTKAGRVGTVDGMRILMDAARDMTSRRRIADWEFMKRNGDATQQVADLNIQMASVEDRESFARVFLGTGSKGGKKGLEGFVHEKGIDGLISYATDVTENLTRSYSHMVGLRLADYHGIQGMEARHTFAREIANATIANYNPLNRPELYNSAFGSMFGLFMSWMQSYNQRLFRWMETGDYAAIGQQLAIQSALFGFPSVPGWNVLEGALHLAGMGQTEAGDSATLTDQLYARFGPMVGSALAFGGLQETGIVLYTRGDMNYREPTLDPTRLMAGVGVLADIGSAMKEAAQSLFSDYGVEDSHRLLEILSRNMPNRMLKGTLVALQGGNDVDAYGKIISTNRDAWETGVRILGLRTQRQQAEIEAFYANKQAKDREAGRLDTLRNETRSLIRNNPRWQNQIQDVFDKYVRAGGTPSHFRTWIRDQIRESTSTRGINALHKAFSNPSNQDKVWRYEMYGG